MRWRSSGSRFLSSLDLVDRANLLQGALGNLSVGRSTTNDDEQQAMKNEEPPMMMNTTMEQRRGLKLNGMASGPQEQLTEAGMTGINFEEQSALLVDRKVHRRNDKRQARLWKLAHLKYRRQLSRTSTPVPTEGWTGAP